MKNIRSKKISDDEKQCRICCMNNANTVLVNCGHGGVCYDCAVIAGKKKDQCFECRGQVEGIYIIDPNPILSNIVKGIELSRVVFKTI